jgi:hypothetical protein
VWLLFRYQAVLLFSFLLKAAGCLADARQVKS